MALSQDVLLEELQKLMAQRDSGALSGEAFEQHAAALLSGSEPPPPPARQVPTAEPEKPPARRPTAWTATPTGVPSATPLAPNTLAPQTQGGSGTSPAAAPPEPSRPRRNAWSAAPLVGTAPNHPAANGNLWSAVPSPASTVPPPEVEPEPGPAKNGSGHVRKSNWAAQPQSGTDAPQAPAAPERTRRRWRRDADAQARPASEPAAPPPNPPVTAKQESVAVPPAGADHEVNVSPVRQRSRSAFSARPGTPSEPVAAESVPKGKPVLRRRGSKPPAPAERASTVPETDKSQPPSPEALRPAPPHPTSGNGTTPEPTATDSKVERAEVPKRPTGKRLRSSSMFAAKPLAEHVDAPPSAALTEGLASGPLGPMSPPEPIVSDIVKDIAVERTGADKAALPPEVEMPQPSASTLDPLPAPTARGASTWVVKPEPLAEPAHLVPDEPKVKEPAPLAPAERRASRGRRKVGKHSQNRRRHDNHVVTVEASPPTAPEIASEQAVEFDPGPLPKSYWDHSRRILPELRSVGEDDEGHKVDFSYWDLSERELAPLPESDDEPELDREGYWSRSIKD